MKWRCEWCGKPHERDDPPCDNCGHGSFEKAVQPVGPEGSGDEPPGGSVWVCQDCGRQHQRNSPPCNRCGGADFERQPVADNDPMDDIATDWRDIIEPKYVAGYLAVAVLLGLLLLGVTGAVSLPGAADAGSGSGPPAVPDAPGAADSVDGLSLAGVEAAYVERLNAQRERAGAPPLARNGTVDEAAAYYNKAVVAARYGDGDGPTREAFGRFDLACDRPSIVAYPVALERTDTPVESFDDEGTLAARLVGSYVERGEPFRAAESGTVGVDVHVAPDGRVFVTHVVC